MKKALILAAVTAFLCICLPWLAIDRPGDPEATAPDLPIATEGSCAEPDCLVDGSISLVVLMPDGSPQRMTLEQYLLGAVLGELPGDFPPEAQKAQAVVCRTYTLRQRQGGKHEKGDVCTDSACCQAWKDPQTFPEQKQLPAREAIAATDGKVLTYEGRLVDATFFSGSGGRTEAAVAVWGTDVPYLQAVDSPGEDAPYDGEAVTFTAQELRLLLETARPGLKLSGSPGAWFGESTHTPGGGVDCIHIGDGAFTGKELRKLLGLRSTVFTVSVKEDGIVFYTRGYGHRVGMSQYGARAMALEGSTWEEILKHYYKGVAVEQAEPDR